MNAAGKPGSLHAGGSVWGDSAVTFHSWQSTVDDLENLATRHNDGLLILDELKEVDPKQAGAIAYMLSNAKGKRRALSQNPVAALAHADAPGAE